MVWGGNMWRAQTRPRVHHQLNLQTMTPQTKDLHGFFIVLRPAAAKASTPFQAHTIFRQIKGSLWYYMARSLITMGR